MPIEAYNERRNGVDLEKLFHGIDETKSMNLARKESIIVYTIQAQKIVYT